MHCRPLLAVFLVVRPIFDLTGLAAVVGHFAPGTLLLADFYRYTCMFHLAFDAVATALFTRFLINCVPCLWSRVQKQKVGLLTTP